jgi:hypothetical protein
MDIDEKFKILNHLYNKFYPFIKECYCHNSGREVSLFLPNNYEMRVYIYHVATTYYQLNSHTGTPHQASNWFHYKNIHQPKAQYVLGKVTEVDFGTDKF